LICETNAKRAQEDARDRERGGELRRLFSSGGSLRRGLRRVSG